MRRLTVSLFALATLAGAAVAPSANAVTSISSSAYGLSADLTVLNLITASISPVDPFSGLAPGAYNGSATVASVADTLGLTLANQGLHTGVIVTSASSPFPGSPTGTANATVNNLATGLNLVLFGTNILSLGATTVSSTSSVDGHGSLSAVGATEIEGLTLSGAALHGVTIDGSLFVDPAPNTVLFNLGGLEILLNEQIPSGDGVNSIGMQTNAIDIIFRNFVLSTGLLNGNIIVSHSEAAITGPAVNAVPEPATWLELLGGFFLIGAVSRRRVARAA